jgi:hypothetical protein
MADGPPADGARAVLIVVSLNVFQAPQSGHCPAHFTLWAPHAEHK